MLFVNAEQLTAHMLSVKGLLEATVMYKGNIILLQANERTLSSSSSKFGG